MRIKAKDDCGDFRFLTPGKEYVVIGVDHESFRVLDDKREPILFPRIVFDVVDETVPGDWIWDRYGQDEYYADPPPMNTPGFYERYFDGEAEARQQFDNFLRRAGLASQD